MVVNAIERAADEGDAAVGLEFAAARSSSACDSRRAGRANGWRAQRADALLAIAKASLASTAAGPRASVPGGSGRGARCRRPECACASRASRITIKSSFTSTKKPSAEGSAAPICRSTASSDSRATAASSRSYEDERGAPLDVGRKQRTVSTPLKRALWSRDRGCTFPGCPNRALHRCASHPPLGRRRRDQPREPHAALLASPPRCCTRAGSVSAVIGPARSILSAPTAA